MASPTDIFLTWMVVSINNDLLSVLTFRRSLFEKDDAFKLLSSAIEQPENREIREQKIISVGTITSSLCCQVTQNEANTDFIYTFYIFGKMIILSKTVNNERKI